MKLMKTGQSIKTWERERESEGDIFHKKKKMSAFEVWEKRIESNPYKEKKG